jgi:hypothetical protein
VATFKAQLAISFMRRFKFTTETPFDHLDGRYALSRREDALIDVRGNVLVWKHSGPNQ